MKRNLYYALTLMTAWALAGPAMAEGPMMQEQWQQLSPEQRAAAREQAHERWASMSPDQRAAAKARMRERYNSLPPEQQEQVRQRIIEQRAAKPQQ